MFNCLDPALFVLFYLIKFIVLFWDYLQKNKLTGQIPISQPYLSFKNFMTKIIYYEPPETLINAKYNAFNNHQMLIIWNEFNSSLIIFIHSGECSF